MATQGIALAKTRIQVIQQKLIDGRIGDLSPDGFGELIYYGKTTDNTASELFIGGKGGAASEGTTYYNRLYLPESTIVFVDYTYLGYNSTDDTWAGLYKGYTCVSNLNGTTAGVFDIVKDTGADVYVQFDIATNGGATGIDLAQAGSSGTASVVPTIDDTGDFLKFVVTGTTAKTIYHKLWARVYSLNETECKSNFYFGDTAAQSTGK